MRLMKMRLKGFKRFEDAEINLDAPVVALVGPNESGKTSLLKALATLLGRSSFTDRDITRGCSSEDTRIEATFLLETADAESLRSDDVNLSDVRRITISKGKNSQRSFATNLPLSEAYDNALESVLPPILEFTDDDRRLRTEYSLQLDQHGRNTQEWNKAVHNLASLAGFDLQELAKVSTGGQHELREGIIAKANERLCEVFNQSWSQSDLTVRLNIIEPHQLQVYVHTDDGEMFRLADRSDGLRAFVALVAFLETMKPKQPPILVLDEAENHLHWDAQADLVNLFHHMQDKVSQIIYSTHSPGCLPHDLGHGVRAVVPDGQHSDRSSIKNWIWESDTGYRPLLLKMGASTAALTPHRFAVMTEGVADFILLPSLLCEAAEKDVLEYQIVPGIANSSVQRIQEVCFESDVVAYLLDGDEGGKAHIKRLKKAGVDQRLILSLPNGVTLEDLVDSTILRDAIQQELRRSGHDPKVPNLQGPSRSNALNEWCSQHEIAPPSKRAIASRVLEVWSQKRMNSDTKLVEEKHKKSLRYLDQKLLEIFEEQKA